MSAGVSVGTVSADETAALERKKLAAETEKPDAEAAKTRAEASRLTRRFKDREKVGRRNGDPSGRRRLECPLTGK
jgi:hypothetical protein